MAGVVEYTDCMATVGLDLPYLNEYAGYNTKLSDGEAPVLSISSLILPLGSLWLGVVVPVRVPSMGQIELFNYLLDLKPFLCWIELLVFKSNTWNHLTVCKQISSGLSKNYYLQTIHLQIVCLMYIFIKRIWP